MQTISATVNVPACLISGDDAECSPLKVAGASGPYLTNTAVCKESRSFRRTSHSFNLFLIVRAEIAVKWKKKKQVYIYYRQMANKKMGNSFNTEIE